jgi:hypothetical protein
VGVSAGRVRSRQFSAARRRRPRYSSLVGRQLPLFEVLEADRDALERRVVDGDEDAARECLQLILEDAAEDLRVGTVAAVVQL